MKKSNEPIGNANDIQAYLHCATCLREVMTSCHAQTLSPADYQMLEVGWTKRGIQVWCRRHNVNVVHIDFEGKNHPANMSSIDVGRQLGIRRRPIAGRFRFPRRLR